MLEVQEIHANMGSLGISRDVVEAIIYVDYGNNSPIIEPLDFGDTFALNKHLCLIIIYF